MKKKENKRRVFLKKLAYTAPVLIALGQLIKPTKALGSEPPPPPGGDDGFPSGF